MPELSLTEQEGATLRKALESYLSDLRMEIADTDVQDFRDSLKREEATLTRLVDQLRGVEFRPGR